MREVRRTILEALLIAVFGAILGLGVNAINSDGLVLRRDYWPKLPSTKPRLPVATTQSTGSQPVSTQPTSELSETEQRLVSEGIGIVHYADVKAMIGDPMYNATLFLLDAREDEHYQAGHIVGAYQCYHAYLERFLPPLLPQLLPSQKIIVYCGGGHCDNSENTAIELIRHGVDAAKVFVYSGGYQDWIAHHEQLEKGERGSGQLISAPPE